MMYLRFAPKEKRVAYAPSLGRNYIPNYNKRTLKRYIADIPCVSVREDEGRRLIKELTGRDAKVVADPTLLMRSHEWDRLKADVKFPPPLPKNMFSAIFSTNPILMSRTLSANMPRRKTWILLYLASWEISTIPQTAYISQLPVPESF